MHVRMLSDQTQHPVSPVKCLDINCHVSVNFGDLLSSDDDNRRRKCASLFGTMITAVDYKHYHVIFYNNEVKECYSNSL